MTVNVFRRTVAAASIIVAAMTVARVQAADSPPIGSRLSGLEQRVASAESRLLRVAQLYERPSEDVQGVPPPEGAQAGPGPGDDPSLRIDRLEKKLRDLTGRIETAEHDIRQVENDLKKFKQDVDFRMQDLAAARGKGRRGDAEEPAVAPVRAAKRRGDAFDPGADPNAPGAPRALGDPQDTEELASPRTAGGRTDARAPLAVDDDPDAPLDLTRGATGSIPRPRRSAGSADATAGSGVPGPTAISPGNAGISPSPGSGARAEFDEAVTQLRQKQYQSAETTLQAFLQKHPRDRLAADAVYYLGETYALRGRQREAAEQFLKVSTDYAKSLRAPEGMIKLGVSLNALGAKEQACATFGEVTRKFPNASAAVKNGAERESKRARC